MPQDGDQQYNSCQFATLATYNGAIGNPALAGQTPVPLTTAVGMQLVPAWAPIGYNSLMRSGQSPCNGYPTIMGAYGTGSNNCQTQYVKRLCA